MKNNTKTLKKISFLFLNLPFRFKIISVVIISLIMLVSTSIAGIRKLQMKYDEILYNAYELVLSVSANVLSDTLNDTEEYVKTIATDSTIQDYLSSIENGEYLSAVTIRNLERELQKYINDNMNPALYGVCVYTDKGVFYNSRFKYDNGYDYSLGTKFSADELDDIVKKAQDKNTMWLTEFSYSYGLVVAQNIRRIRPMRLDSIGLLIGCLNLQPVLSDCTKNLQQEECCFMLLDENGDSFYSYKNMEEDISFMNKVRGDQKYAVVKQEKSSYFVIHGKIKKNNWDYIYAIPYDSIAKTIQRATWDIVLTMCVCIFTSVCITVLILRQILHDFDKLMNMIDNVSDIDFKSVELGEQDMKRSDEVGILMRRFIRMSNKIDCLIRDNYESRLLFQEAKLQALEMQINPHFLYNTLESVRCCAKLGQNDNVCSIVECLGNIVHLIMSNYNNEVHLEEELNLINDYILIQKIRFDQRLDFISKVDTQCNHAVLPKLTLLPIVENAVVHGVENSPDVCRIELKAWKKDEQIHIQIRNTGTYFVDSFFQKLVNKEIIPTGHGIGLLNVDGRLKLFFKNDYSINLYNEKQYAVVDLTLPYWTTRDMGREKLYD